MKSIQNLPGKLLTDLWPQWLEVLDKVGLGVFVVDSKMKVMGLNQTARTLMSLGEVEAVGLKCRGLACSMPCHGRCPFHAQEECGTRVYGESSLELIGASEEKHLVTRFVIPLVDGRGNTAGCLTILQDYSAFSDLMERVDYEESRLKDILDNLDVGIFSVNKGGYITFFNRAAEKITGYPRRKVLGRFCAELFATETEYEADVLRSVIFSGVLQRGRKGWLKTKMGEHVPISATYMALKNAGGKTIGGIATFNDLTLAHQLDRVMLDRYAYKDMIGKDPKMKKIFDLVAVVSKTDATMLIEGETGTGKDLIAKVIHDSSARKKMPFVKVNCAALPDNLLESELFGFMKGAFTGAHQNRRGRFQEADGGTIFLDEIGELPIGLQAKLLRVIEDKEFYRLGDSRTVKVDVRILSATNRDLKAMTKTGRFREDLLYRLNVFRITLPPLRERPEDLPLLIRHITRRLSAAKGNSAPEISNNAMRMLLAHDYPGNVRELENILQHAMIISPGNRLRASHLPAAFHSPPFFRHKGKGIPTEKSMEKEKSHLLAILEKNNWNRTQTARELKIHRATLWRKMRSLGISSEK